MTKEEFISRFVYEGRFHLHIDERYSLIMLEPEFFGYLYELYDLESHKIIGRYSSIIQVSDKIKRLRRVSSD